MQYSNPVRVQEIKADGDDWEVSGYASTFGNVDLGMDVVMFGAFKKTLKDGPRVRFLMAHNPSLVLGVPTKLHEDNKGLFGRFKISKTALGADTRQLLLDGAIDSFSIGYEADEWDIKDDVRRLKAVKLYEVSLVPIPMNPEAIVTGVKTLAERTAGIHSELANLLNELRGLTEQGRSLNENKRQELAELLETFSGLDDVRQNLQGILITAPSRQLVEARHIRHELAELRKRQAI